MAYDIKAASNLLIALPPFPPIIRGWNRLEGRPRTVDYERALRAEVRDALWFLTRQWQFGELQGEDAGSPIDARVVVRSTPLLHFALPGEPATPFDATRPLEAHVEGERPPRDLDFHVELSRQFFRRVAAQLPSKVALVRTRYQTEYPLIAASLAGVFDADAAAMLPLAARHGIDGGAFLDAVASGAHETFVQGLPAPFTAADRDDLRSIADELTRWAAKAYSQSTDGASAWNKPFLEYQFACATEADGEAQAVLRADAYTGGHLDWYSFDIDTRASSRLQRPDGGPDPLPTVTETALSFLPAPVSFGGMPNPRYWEMENGKTEFADIDANTTDVAKLLLTEFALVYSNDWCAIPYEVDVGTLNDVTGLLVTDDFGEQILVRAAGRGVEDVWQRWAMYTLSTNAPNGQADVRLFVPPTVTKLLEAAPIEKVHFLRDEMANMAWGVERVVPMASGGGANGYDPSHAPAAPVPAPGAPPAKPLPRYVLGTDVPDNWFPFIPVHVGASNRQIQLQRARMPGPGRAIRGEILRGPTPYYLNEEEIPRAGKIVTRSWQRARWLNGATFLWLGRAAVTGKGEGSSGLAFDQVVESNAKS